MTRRTPFPWRALLRTTLTSQNSRKRARYLDKIGNDAFFMVDQLSKLLRASFPSLARVLATSFVEGYSRHADSKTEITRTLCIQLTVPNNVDKPGH